MAASLPAGARARRFGFSSAPASSGGGSGGASAAPLGGGFAGGGGGPGAPSAGGSGWGNSRESVRREPSRGVGFAWGSFRGWRSACVDDSGARWTLGRVLTSDRVRRARRWDRIQAVCSGSGQKEKERGGCAEGRAVGTRPVRCVWASRSEYDGATRLEGEKVALFAKWLLRAWIYRIGLSQFCIMMPKNKAPCRVRTAYERTPTTA